MKRSDEYFGEDGQRLHFTTDDCNFEFEGIFVSFKGVPFLKDEATDDSYLPQSSRVLVERFAQEAKRRELSEFTMTPPAELRDKRFSYCKNFPFKYSALEYYFIPGLIQGRGDGFLTPVYFNVEVLNKYTQNPDYDLKLMSSTYGSLYYKDEWNVAFGVNRNKSVIFWLGDINGLPEKEKYYLLSENVDPEFEIHSEFYNGQICVEWAEGALESKAFEARELLSDLVLEKYVSKLFKLEGEISKVISDLQKPVFWEDRHVTPIIESLNRVFVESLCEDGIKKIIIERSSDAEIKGLKGLKLFGKLLSDVFCMEEADVLMCPFFVLYDYRIVMCHLQSSDTVASKMDSIRDRLNVDEGSGGNEIIYMAIFDGINRTFEKIISHIRKN